MSLPGLTDGTNVRLPGGVRSRRRLLVAESADLGDDIAFLAPDAGPDDFGSQLTSNMPPPTSRMLNSAPGRNPMPPSRASTRRPRPYGSRARRTCPILAAALAPNVSVVVGFVRVQPPLIRTPARLVREEGAG